ncbi:unnamed protein product [Pelagomonas calceolata]|uniref:40S ribosomal protein S2 n=1 Tax=Pelagomonas calceolata TaxID=35677 RepID=A0A8J2T0C2_9STRA|nr:unnamed protein product [Pelagomonas calceolata]
MLPVGAERLIEQAIPPLRRKVSKWLRFPRNGRVFPDTVAFFRRHRHNGAANSLVDILRRGGDDKDEWIPVTKLGRLVKEGRIRSLEEIFLHSMPIKEHQIVDHFFPPTAGKLKDEVMTIKPVQKQSSAGQRTRFKAYVAVGDFDGHIGLGKKCSSEVATAIRGALIMAKMHLVPIRRGYWGSATASENENRRVCHFERVSAGL